MTWHGMAWHDMTWHDMTWHDMTWHDMAWHGMTWHGMAWHGMTWHDMTWHDMTWHDMTWHDMNDMTWHDMTWHDMTWHDMTCHDMTWHDMTWHDMTWHYITLHYITLHDITWHYMTLHDITWHYMTLHDITWHYMTLHDMTWYDSQLDIHIELTVSSIYISRYHWSSIVSRYSLSVGSADRDMSDRIRTRRFEPWIVDYFGSWSQYLKFANTGSCRLSPAPPKWRGTNIELYRSCFFQLRRLRAIRHCLTQKSILMLAHSFICNRIDYCNSVLYGASRFQLDRLQSILNAAARIVLRIPKFSHISASIRDELHWLPVRFRPRVQDLPVRSELPGRHCPGLPPGTLHRRFLQRRSSEPSISEPRRPCGP